MNFRRIYINNRIFRRGLALVLCMVVCVFGSFCVFAQENSNGKAEESITDMTDSEVMSEETNTDSNSMEVDQSFWDMFEDYDDEDSEISLDDILRTSLVAAQNYVGAINAANQWQIVAEQYSGNENSNKQGKDLNGDGINDLWIQKNVIPTGVENQFRVYLSHTVQMTWDELLGSAVLGLTTQRKWKINDEGRIVNYSEIGGNATNELTPGQSGGRQYKATIYLKRNGRTVHTYSGWYSGTTPNASNCTGFIKLNGILSNKVIIASTSVNLHQSGSGSGGSLDFTIDLDTMLNHGIYFSVDPIELDKVTDQMGDYIIFKGIDKSDGPATYTDDVNPKRTITWYPDETAANVTGTTLTEGGKTTGYLYNICQMVYTVTLDVKKDMFNSCADNMNNATDSYFVNNSAKLNYHFGSTNGEAIFKQPKVRGLLYNIDCNKKSDDGGMLPGAKFALYKVNGTSETLIQEITTGEEKSRFSNLEFGDYVLREISPPPHYKTSGVTEWKMRLCYTDSASYLEQDKTMPDNMRYKKNDVAGNWNIINNYIPIKYKVQVIKTDDNDTIHLLQGAEFEISNPSSMPYGKLNGVTNSSGKIDYAPYFDEDTEYTLTELLPPDGYMAFVYDIGFKVVVDKKNDYEVSAKLTDEQEISDYVSYELEPIDTNDYKYLLKVTVKNKSGEPLPLTGGSGNSIYKGIGLILLAFALLYGFTTNRRREGKGEKI